MNSLFIPAMYYTAAFVDVIGLKITNGRRKFWLILLMLNVVCAALYTVKLFT